MFSISYVIFLEFDRGAFKDLGAQKEGFPRCSRHFTSRERINFAHLSRFCNFN